MLHSCGGTTDLPFLIPVPWQFLTRILSQQSINHTVHEIPYWTWPDLQHWIGSNQKWSPTTPSPSHLWGPAGTQGRWGTSCQISYSKNIFRESVWLSSFRLFGQTDDVQLRRGRSCCHWTHCLQIKGLPFPKFLCEGREPWKKGTSALPMSKILQMLPQKILLPRGLVQSTGWLLTRRKVWTGLLLQLSP